MYSHDMDVCTFNSANRITLLANQITLLGWGCKLSFDLPRASRAFPKSPGYPRISLDISRYPWILMLGSPKLGTFWDIQEFTVSPWCFVPLTTSPLVRVSSGSGTENSAEFRWFRFLILTNSSGEKWNLVVYSSLVPMGARCHGSHEPMFLKELGWTCGRDGRAGHCIHL